MQRVYFILAVAGWIWLIVAAVVMAVMLWRKRNAEAAQRGSEPAAAEPGRD